IARALAGPGGGGSDGLTGGAASARSPPYARGLCRARNGWPHTPVADAWPVGATAKWPIRSSFRLHAGGVDDLRPLGDLVGQELAGFRRGAADGLDPELGEALLDVRLGQRLRRLFGEALDDRRGRAGR